MPVCVIYACLPGVYPDWLLDAKRGIPNIGPSYRLRVTSVRRERATVRNTTISLRPTCHTYLQTAYRERAVYIRVCHHRSPCCA